MATRSTKAKATKGKATKVTKAARNAKTKASKCNSGPADAWLCFIPRLGGTYEGAFAVLQEDSAGNFEGVHASFSATGIVRDNIRGVCDGVTIKFWRPATSPRYEYSGRFSGNQIVDGERKDLKKPIRPEQDEEWEAVKTTTLMVK